eukprot:SAG22_NODE_545_length_9265_cov_7.988108_3_plen_199_part_00
MLILSRFVRVAFCFDGTLLTRKYPSVGMDNSTYQVSGQQLEMFTAALSSAPGPVVLLVHIPLFLPELQGAMRARGLVGYSGSSFCGYPGSTNEAYRPTESTAAFMEAVHGSEKLAAVLAGHIHTAQQHAIRGDWVKLAPGPLPVFLGGMQYVTEASVYNGSRTISFEPAAGKFGTLFAADIGRRQRVLQAFSRPASKL